MNAFWNFYLIGFDFVRTSATQRDRSGRSVQRFFKCDQNVRFDIGAAFSGCFASAKSAECGTASAAAEKRFEEIAESRTAELELHAATIAAVLIKSASGSSLRATSPVRRRLKSARLVPIRAELVVFLPLLRIA